MKAIISLLAFLAFFAQGYFFRDALFKLIPFMSDTIRAKTRGYLNGIIGQGFIRALTMIIAAVILLLVLPGFVQVGVIILLNIGAADIAVGSATGWLLGLFAEGLIVQIRRPNDRDSEERAKSKEPGTSARRNEH